MKVDHLENPWKQWKECPGPHKTIKELRIGLIKVQISWMHYYYLEWKPL
jgi:hypothetical protein